MISIIIPVYKVESYLHACVESVKSQTYTDWEAILVDDGSPDRCPEICDNLAATDSRIRVIHRKNGGLSAARNTGLDHARGESLTFIDSDDLIAPDYLQTLVDIKQTYGAEISSVGFMNFSGSQCPNPKGSLKTYSVSSREAIKKILYQTDSINTSACGKLFDSDLWKDIRFKTGIIYEDLEAIHKVVAGASTVAYTDRKLYYYRKAPGSILSGVSPRRADALNVAEGIERYFSQYPEDMLAAAQDRLLSASFNILGLIEAYPGPLDSQRDRCLHNIRRLKRKSFLNPSVRMKNKIGITVFTLLGERGYRLFAKRIYRR